MMQVLTVTEPDMSTDVTWGIGEEGISEEEPSNENTSHRRIGLNPISDHPSLLTDGPYLQYSL